MQIQSNKTWPWLALAMALFAASPILADENFSRELSYFVKVYSSDYVSREISVWTGNNDPVFASREISVWTGSNDPDFASREISFYSGMPQEFASREYSLNLFGTLELADGFIGREFTQLPAGESYWMALAPAKPGVDADPGSLYFTVATSLWGDPGDDPDDFLYKARVSGPVQELATFASHEVDPIGIGFAETAGFGDDLFIASAHFGADEGVEEGGGLLRYEVDSGVTSVVFQDTLVAKSPQRFDIAESLGSFQTGLYGTNMGAGVNEAFALDSSGTPLGFVVDHSAPMLCARMAEAGDFGAQLYLGSEDGYVYRADALGTITPFSTDLGSPVEALDFGSSGLFDGYLYALLRDGRVQRLIADGSHSNFASGLLPGVLVKGPARNDLRFSGEGNVLFLSDVLRSRIYSIRSDVLVGVDEEAGVPAVTALQGNYPNPFNPKTNLRFSLAEPVKVELSIYSVTGRRVRQLAGGELMNAGVHELEWDGRNDRGEHASTGIYFARMKAGSESFTRKMLLLK
ncbi:T9SS type A sorting domain-containing protein [bacterium]|nr:T9SS type A sorting domain-containing protein [bacterium]